MRPFCTGKLRKLLKFGAQALIFAVPSPFISSREASIKPLERAIVRLCRKYKYFAFETNQRYPPLRSHKSTILPVVMTLIIMEGYQQQEAGDEWRSVIKPNDYDDDEVTTIACSECSDDNVSVDSELNDLHEDLDETADSLKDLRLEFFQDLELLYQGLDSAFEQFEEGLFEEQDERFNRSTRSFHLKDETARNSLRASDLLPGDSFEEEQERKVDANWLQAFWLDMIEKMKGGDSPSKEV